MSHLVVEFAAAGPKHPGPPDLSFDELRGPAEAVARAAELLDAIEPSTRDEYVRWIGDRSVEAMSGLGPGGNRVLGDMPVWWLSSASMRDNEADPTFERLCRLIAIERAMAAERSARLVALAPDAAMDAVLARLTRERGIAYESHGVRPGRTGPSLTRALAGRLRIAARLLASAAIALPLRRIAVGPGGVSFLCTWPQTLSLDPEPRDSSFRGLLDAARRDLDAGILTVVHPAYRRPSRIVKLARRGRGSRLTALSRHVRFSDLRAVVRSATVAIACAREARRVRREAGHRFLGLDARELLDLPLLARLSSAEVGYHLALAGQAERWARSERPSALVSALELYPIARAVYHGARRGHPAVTVIAVQHATVTPGKLWYALDPRESRGQASIPLPDQILCQGEGARDVFLAGGVPAEALKLTGSPRFDALREGDLRGRGDAALILPSLDARDGIALVEAALEACDAAGLEPRVLAHPMQAAPARVAARRAEIEERPLYVAMESARAVIASYSTTGDEAIVRGLPVAIYAGLRPLVAASGWTGAAPVARTPARLVAVVRELVAGDGGVGEEARARHIHWAFHRVDGRATERCLTLIRAASEGEPST